ncbi:M56 family metallopeptidase [Telluribacter sp. SYSU D00476]|uniref:M56 family metallopeptidase n=1 Tax=Telluribacter sp. SYSU D00476 TaxID=2811430 RepID=UPI001FF21FBA|nr:M56 family metallopeptidase [Telluribacter sp. SYSU D00476]
MIPYILHTALLVGCCYVFYRILLQKETFYQLNRFLLLACLLLSFLLPLAPVPHQWAISLQGTPPTAQQSEPSVSGRIQSASGLSQGDHLVSGNLTTVLPESSFYVEQLGTLVTWIYWIGVAAFSLNFLVQLSMLGYRAYSGPVIRDGRYRIVELSGDQAPCSFGNTIFINPEKYDWETYEQILIHEKVHVQQGHTLDLVLAEVMLVFQWFNPLAWLYRREMETNLEFLTDDQVLQQGDCEKTAYQMSLLKVAAPHFPLSLTTNYNQSLLKRRIAMMNAKKSNLNSAWKYFFLLPVLVLTVCLLNEPMARGESINVNFEPVAQSKPEKAEGTWLATLEGDRVTVQFFDRYGDRSSQFRLSELEGYSAKGSDTFSLTREAGTLQLTGSFKENKGSGHYEFIGNKSYRDLMSKEGIRIKEDEELMTFFLLDISNAYVQTLKKHGYTQLKKQDLTSLATFGVGKADKQDTLDVPEPGPEDTDPLGVMINSKMVGITDEFIKGFHDKGYKNIPPGTMINFKSVGVTPDYIQSFEKAGYRDIPYGTIINFKSVGVTPEFIRSFEDAGFKNVPYGTYVNLKSTGVTPPKG